ncbi:MAG: response regulator [Bacteroidales bacterium]
MSEIKKYNFVVVDDNPDLAIIIEHLLRVNHLDGTLHYFENPIKALNFLKVSPCDMLITDIEMPEMSGLELIGKLENPPYTVIMTAFDQKYAVEAYSYLDKNLLDFLPKSAIISQFPRIKDRFLNRFQTDFLLVNRNDITDEYIKIKLDDIKYFQQVKHITYVITEESHPKELYINRSLLELQSFLSQNSCFQIRKCTLIMMKHIIGYRNYTVNLGKGYDGNDILLDVPFRQRRAFLQLYKKQ